MKVLKRLVILLTIIIGVGLLLFFTQRYQLSRMNQSVLARAEEAEKAGELEKASQLYQEHLAIAPDDQDAKAKLADTLVKESKNPARQDQAIALYSEVLSRNGGRRDVRRHRAELLFARERYAEAREDLEILASDPSQAKDGRFQFLLGRCRELREDASKAATAYQAAIDNHAPDSQLIEAYRRLASLLRGPLKDPAGADGKIKEMLAAQPNNPQVYLESGRYYRDLGNLVQAKSDFERAVNLSPQSPAAYLELATLASQDKKPDEARRILEMGLKALPREPVLYEAMARLEATTVSLDKGIAVLRDALQKMPDDPTLHYTLAYYLAERGETTALGLEIDDLKRLNYVPVLVNLLEARLQLNNKEWARARQSLLRIQPIFDRAPVYKLQIELLLARCFQELGDVDRQRAAVESAAAANPDSVPVQMRLAENLVQRGEVEQAIDVYRKLQGKVSQADARLAQLLIARGRKGRSGSEDWNDAEAIIRRIAEKDPRSIEPLLLRANLLLAQGRTVEALRLLDRERSGLEQDASRALDAISLLQASADVLRVQRQFARARTMLDQADPIARKEIQALRDQAAKASGEEASKLRTRADLTTAKLADVQLQKARLLIAGRGPDVVAELRTLIRDADSLPRPIRQPFLENLASESTALEDFAFSRELWSEVIKLDPRKLGPRLRWLELAFESTREEPTKEFVTQIETQLAEVKAIDGVDGLMSRFQECRYLLWQARLKKDETEKSRLRIAARNLLDELATRRADWSVIPLTLGKLAEHELDEMGEKVTKEEKDAKKREAADQYLKAVQLGNRDFAVIQANALLDELKDKEGQARLFNLLPGGVRLRAALEDRALEVALNKKNLDRAVEIASQAIKDNPGNVAARRTLAQLQMAKQQFAEAEQTLREGDPQHAIPELQVPLIQLLARTRQLEKAEQTAQAAEGVLKEKDPIGLARCCESIGLAHRGVKGDEERAKVWIDKATQFFEAALKARPEDLKTLQQFVDFQLRTAPVTVAKESLTKIVENKGPTPKTPDQVAWARRSLSLVQIATRDYEQRRQALETVRPIEEALQQGRATPEDRRALIKVYEAQGDRGYQQKARKLAEDLVASKDREPEDRFYLAVRYVADGDWPKAQDQFDRLIAETEQAADLETKGRLPVFLSRYLSDLLSRYEGHPEPALLERVQAMLEKYKRDQPGALSAVALEARFLKHQNQPDRAAAVLETRAKDEKLSDAAVLALAKQAEDLSLLDASKRMLKQHMDRSNTPPNQLALALFLGRHGELKEALDMCERLWNGSEKPEVLVEGLMLVLFGPGGKLEPPMDQVNRVAAWFEKALNQRPSEPRLMTGLASLRERQQRFPEAEDLYRQALKQDPTNVNALNNLAWLMSLRNDKTGEAIELIDRAIGHAGPVAELLDTRGMVYLAAGKQQEAIDDLTRAVERDPAGPKYFHLAEAYLRANLREKATEALARAREKGLKESDLHLLEAAPYRKVVSDLGGR